MVEQRSVERMSHTPGPWKVIPPGHGHATGYLCVQYGADERYTSLEMLPADAHLCAAAPDLLALVKKLASECAECHGHGYTYSDDGITGFGPDDREPTREACAECADIREVIAKAAGRESPDPDSQLQEARGEL